MARPQSERDLVADLRLLVRSNDTAALQEHLRDHADELGRGAGVSASLVEARASSDHPRRAAKELLECARRRQQGQSRYKAEERVRGALTQLQSTARWTEDEVHLEVAVLLGELLAFQGSHLVFLIEGQEVVVRRKELLGLRRLRRRLSVLAACLTPEALVLSWNGGRSGLRLRCRTAQPCDLNGALRVVFVRPALNVEVRGAWLRDALTSVLDQLAAQ